MSVECAVLYFKHLGAIMILLQVPRMRPKKSVVDKRPPPSNFRWFFGHIFRMLRRHGNFVLGCGLVGYCVRESSLAVMAFAGHQSIADLKFGVLANVSVVATLSVTVSGASIGL